MKKIKLFFFVYLFFWLAENNLSPYLGLYYEERGMSGTQIAALGSIFSVAVAIAAIALGMVGDCFKDLRKLLVLLCAGLVASVMALSVAHSFGGLALTLVLYGIVYSPFNGIVDKMLMEQLGNQKENFGSYRMGGTIGAGIGVIIGSFFLQRFSFMAVFAIYWLAMAACAGTVVRLPKSTISLSTGSEKVQKGDYLEIIRNKRFISLYFPMALWGFTETGVMQFLALHVGRCGYHEKYTSIFIMGAMIGEAIMFWGASHILTYIHEKNTLILAFFLQMVRLLSLSFLTVLPIELVIFFQVIGGGAYACLYSTITKAISETYVERIACTAHNLKLVIMRGIGTVGGLLLLGCFYDVGNTALAYLLFSMAAALYICCIWKGKLWV